MSLLLDHGHPEAWSYPLGMVIDEADLVVTRLNQREALRARLVQAAVSATPNGFVEKSAIQKVHDSFNKLLGILNGDKRSG